MNKTFDLHRLGMVIRWDVLSSWAHNLGALAGLAISFSIFNIIRLYNISGFVSASDDLDALSKSYQQSATMFFGFISFMAIYVLASCIFRNMKTKLQRESFLMLPATENMSLSAILGITMTNSKFRSSSISIASLSVLTCVKRGG